MIDFWHPKNKEDALRLAGGNSHNARQLMIERKAKRICDMVPPGSVFLDFGCGPGRFFPYWEKFLVRGKNVRVCGVDSSGDMLKYTSDTIEIFTTDLELPFYDGTVDFIFSNAVLIHVDLTTLCRLFREFSRVLSSTGIMVHDILISNPKTIRKVVANQTKANPASPPLFCYSATQIESICEFNGLEFQANIYSIGTKNAEKRSVLRFWPRGACPESELHAKESDVNHHPPAL